MNRAIIIMTKAPIAGTVKTRLHPILSPEKCAELAAAFLLDAAGKAQTVDSKKIIAFSPSGNRDELKAVLRPENLFIEQTGAGLGERMFDAFEFAFEQNSDSVVMIGTDSPTFPADYIEQAFASLEKADAVLGKTTDGGFYLIGLRRLRKEIFKNIEWSSARAFRQTKRNITHLNFNLHEIPAWYDVDNPEDLRRLFSEFQTDKRAREIAPETFKWLANQEIFLKPND
jgi:rSAM/selenodomain-associated transferase 1